MKMLYLAIISFTLAVCTPDPKRPLAPAFFWWETSFNPSTSECSLLDSLGCKTLYVKILDIGKSTESGEIEPFSRTEISDTTALAGIKIIPTIFITNEVFQNISPQKIDWLTEKIAASSRRTDMLFDCDWTPSTREAFFLFLKKMRARLPPASKISATIRLHQYKFPQKTGVPPVDRGMLMFYNTGDVDEEGLRNSIFHPEDALKYLEGAPKHYPLPLDLGLPLFSWGLVFREGELWKIVPGPLPLSSMRTSGKYVEDPGAGPFPATLWQVKEGTFLGGHYLRPGDHLRVSAISPELLLIAASLARKIDLANDASLAFFHLGIARSEHFSAQLLDSVCQTARK